MDSWLRIAAFAVVILSLLRRVLKARAQGGVPSPTPRANSLPIAARITRGGKNDFRDVPPPPENPELG